MKKILTVIILTLLVIGAGLGIWYKNHLSQNQQASKYPIYEDIAIKITSIDKRQNIITGTAYAQSEPGSYTGPEIKILNTKYFYDKNDKIVTINYFSAGMKITSRGNKVNDNTFYADWVHELPVLGNQGK